MDKNAGILHKNTKQQTLIGFLSITYDNIDDKGEFIELRWDKL